MLLVIDNYDSFTYNLVQYFGELGEQSVHRNDSITVEEALALKPDRLMISPGPCSPNEAGVSLAMIEAFSEKFPFSESVWDISLSVNILEDGLCVPIV